MLKIKVTEKSGASIEYVNDGEVIERLSSMGHGLPERWVLKDSAYDPADVIEERTVIDQEASPEILEVTNESGEIVQEYVPATEEISHQEVKLRAEYTVEITDITAELEQQKTNEECLKYLTETDWYIIRELDSGIPCPSEIKVKRMQCRSKIVR